MRNSTRHEKKHGQILAIFALGLVAIVAAVGLVIDGGFTFAQRRAEQNAADLAAFAGANALLNSKDATAAALASSADNGYAHGVNATVMVDVQPTTVKVDITAPHQNYFAGVIPGMGSWDVSVTATALTGVPTRFLGVAPFVFSQEAFDPISGLPYADLTDPLSPFDFSKMTGGTADAPITFDNMAWTDLGTDPNVSQQDVAGALDGSAPINADLQLNQYIGQHNNGVQNSSFDTNSSNPSVNTVLAGEAVAVPIVGPSITANGAPIDGPDYCSPDNTGTPHTYGCFRGWALFHVVSATKKSGTDAGTITGYFLTGITRSASADSVCAVGDPACAGLFHGVYVIKLIN